MLKKRTTAILKTDQTLETTANSTINTYQHLSTPINTYQHLSTGWWFGTFFLFHNSWVFMVQSDFHSIIFQRARVGIPPTSQHLSRHFQPPASNPWRREAEKPSAMKRHGLGTPEVVSSDLELECPDYPIVYIIILIYIYIHIITYICIYIYIHIRIHMYIVNYSNTYT